MTIVNVANQKDAAGYDFRGGGSARMSYKDIMENVQKQEKKWKEWETKCAQHEQI